MRCESVAKAYPTNRRPKPYVSLVGRTFGRWSVVAHQGYCPDRGGRVYTCVCECGTERPVLAHALLAGRSNSCKGCGGRLTHGHSRTGNRLAEYSVWLGIKNRCLFSSNPHMRKNYADRGITVCARWRESFEAFLADMGPRPSPTHSIDRRDNDGHYSCGTCPECVEHDWPANCHWATVEQQTRNKRTSRLLTLNGETRAITQWARVFGLHPGTVSYRLGQGMSPEQALATPRRGGRRPNVQS